MPPTAGRRRRPGSRTRPGVSVFCVFIDHDKNLWEALTRSSLWGPFCIIDLGRGSFVFPQYLILLCISLRSTLVDRAAGSLSLSLSLSKSNTNFPRALFQSGIHQRTRPYQLTMNVAAPRRHRKRERKQEKVGMENRLWYPCVTTHTHLYIIIEFFFSEDRGSRRGMEMPKAKWVRKNWESDSFLYS